MSLTKDPQKWNRKLQQYVTKSLELRPEFFREKWDKSREHLMALKSAGGDPSASRAMELGTGWHPIVPIGLALCGCREVFTVDVESLIERAPVADVIEAYLGSGIEELNHERLELARKALADRSLGGHELMAAIGVTPLICDARAIPLESGTIDLFLSNNTFEHIPEDALRQILREFARLASERAVMSHHVDLADHYANFDSTISVYNYLKYSDSVWRLFNNHLQFQNRLRHSDYLRLHREAGWQVFDGRQTRKPAQELAAIRLAPQFRKYEEQDLLVYDAWIWSKSAESPS